MHDRVEGVVVLYAVIHSDGSVSDIRVLEGFDERLNENARKALSQWRFRPGTKEGTPVTPVVMGKGPMQHPVHPGLQTIHAPLFRTASAMAASTICTSSRSEPTPSA